MTPIDIAVITFGAVFCILGLVMTVFHKQITDMLAPKPNAHPFTNMFRTLGSMLFFVSGQIGGSILILLGALLIFLGLK